MTRQRSANASMVGCHGVRGGEAVHQRAPAAAGLGDMQPQAVDHQVAPADRRRHGCARMAAVYATVGGGSCGAPP